MARRDRAILPSRSILSRICSLFPILGWLPTYSKTDFMGDLFAGVTVGLMVLPQGIAYAELCDLPHQYGIYTALPGVLFYFIFGTAKDITVGPTAIVSLLVGNVTHSLSSTSERITRANTLGFLAGLIQMALGILQLGQVFDLISKPVLTGFINVSAMSIAALQIRGLLGISKKTRRQLVFTVVDVIKAIKGMKWDVVYLSICMLVVLELLKRIKPKPQKASTLSKSKEPKSNIQIALSNVRVILSVLRNAVIVILAGLTSHVVQMHMHNPFPVVGNISRGLPSPALPTIKGDELTLLLPRALIVAAISSVETIAIGKAFAEKNGYRLSPSQELLAIGAANSFGSILFRAFPVAGSFSRSAIMSSSGARTPSAGLFTAAVVLFASYVLNGFLSIVPKAALSAVIAPAALSMLEFKPVKELYRTYFWEFLVVVVTAATGATLGIEQGVGAGICTQVLVLLGTLFVSQTRESGPFTFLALTKLENQYCGDNCEETDKGANNQDGLPQKALNDAKLESSLGEIGESSLDQVQVMKTEEEFTFPSTIDVQGVTNIPSSPANNSSLGDKGHKARVLNIELVPWMDYTSVAAILRLAQVAKRDGLYLKCINVRPQPMLKLSHLLKMNPDVRIELIPKEADTNLVDEGIVKYKETGDSFIKEEKMNCSTHVFNDGEGINDPLLPPNRK